MYNTEIKRCVLLYTSGGFSLKMHKQIGSELVVRNTIPKVFLFTVDVSLVTWDRAPDLSELLFAFPLMFPDLGKPSSSDAFKLSKRC